MTGRQKINLDPDIVRVAERGTRRCRATTRCGSERRRPRSRVRAYQSSWQAVIHSRSRRGGYLSDQSLLSGADRSYAWVVTRTDARKKRRWLTGTSVT